MLNKPELTRPVKWTIFRRHDRCWIGVRRLGHNLGYGVGDDLDDLLAEHGFDGES